SNNGCTKSDSVFVNDPPAIAVIVNTTSQGCTGSASASASGGSLSSGVFTYSWSNGSTGQTTTSVITGGTYTLTVKDGFGCTKTATTAIPIDLPTLTGVSVVETINKEACWGTGDGAIDLTLSGSNATSLKYKWSNASTLEDIKNLISGNYFVEIYNSSMTNCIAKSYNVPIDGTNCGSVSGNVFIDGNLNCTYNTGEIYFQNAIVTANPGNRNAITDQNGNYVFNNMSYATYSISHAGKNNIFPSCGSSQNVTVNAGNPIINNINFVDTASPKIDIQVTSWCSAIVPGFSGSVSLSLNNLLKTSASGKLTVVLPAGFAAAIINCTPASDGINGDTVFWNYTNLITASTYQINFTTPVNTALGSTFKCCANASVAGYEVDLTNNSACAQAIVRGSFDPNDKSVSPIDKPVQGGITLADNELTYQIRFQNTGNGPAVNIIVKDTLSDKLDVSTLQMIRASHNYILDILPGNVLRWRFNSIMLPDKGSDEPGSHGWIVYRIKQNSSNQIGDIIKNTAHIYFDFNEAVVTNTTVSKLVLPLMVNESATGSGNVMVFPNPFSELTTFVVEQDKINAPYSFELIDVLGKKVKTMNQLTGKQFEVTRTGLQNGIYFYKIYTDKNVIGVGKLVVE
ncbi:MAG: T9SS type A sorting domain-containing protein, partial [Bacteroidia bacterium]|nr:T9SS type A sorting domain-containing protein [Bacteroidia bacterium]